MQVPKVAIAIGDPAGIGPEVALKAARHPEVRALCQPVLVGSREALAMHAAPCGISLDALYIRDVKQPAPRIGAPGIERPRIAVGGVNPHAGEAGAFGREELDIVIPAVEAARQSGMVLDGPYGADTLIQRTGYDAYVVMLHDQGHVAAKLLAPNRAAALTLGTPVLFSSVGHGSALDIAGQGKADPAAMVEAITRLVARRRRAVAT